MPVILKHDITRVFEIEVTLDGPIGYDFLPLHVAWQHDKLCLWAQHTSTEGARHNLEIAGFITGASFKQSNWTYLTTVTHDGTVLHLHYRSLA
jgi:hypothetical protein